MIMKISSIILGSVLLFLFFKEQHGPVRATKDNSSDLIWHVNFSSTSPATKSDTAPDVGTHFTGTSFHSKETNNFGGEELYSTYLLPLYSLKASFFTRNESDIFLAKNGMYEVTLGLTKTNNNYCSKPTGKVSTIYVDRKGKQEEKKKIIHSIHDSCFKPKILRVHPNIGADSKRLAVQSIGIEDFVRIINVQKQMDSECIPESLDGSASTDHTAHAVPGTYPPDKSISSYTDIEGKGYVNVRIDGYRSHTHYFDSVNNIVGRIVSYSWTDLSSGKVLSRNFAFNYNFPVGTTRLQLQVIDNFCNVDKAATSVMVSTTMYRGQYCYFYRPDPQNTNQRSNNIFYSEDFQSLELTRGYFRSNLYENSFWMQCFFQIMHSGPPKEIIISAFTKNSGKSVVHHGSNVVYNLSVSPFGRTTLFAGLNMFDLEYSYDSESGFDPYVAFRIDYKIASIDQILYDRSAINPTISRIDPEFISARDNAPRVTIYGFGFFFPPKVYFGDKLATIEMESFTQYKFTVTAPPPKVGERVRVYAETSSGRKSNEVWFRSLVNECDSVSFTKRKLVYVKDNYRRNVDFLRSPTSATLGPDGRLYMGTYKGSVEVLGYDPITLIAKTHCYSQRFIRNYRFLNDHNKPSDYTVLGVAFNPYDREIVPYVTASVLNRKDSNWRVKRSNKEAWMNGMVVRMRIIENPLNFPIGQRSGPCLIDDEVVVENLPVSALDHAVNSLVFDQDGSLLIAVGSFTNMGLPSKRFFGHWESFLSGAILIAPMRKLGTSFNGRIQYSNNSHSTAWRRDGEVFTYATGLRNPFPLLLTQRNDLYTIDQGSNCRYGNWATSCSEFNQRKDNSINEDLPPISKLTADNNCPSGESGASRDDKVIRIKREKFYGHPNQLRSGGTECAWIDQLTNRAADGALPPVHYVPAVGFVPSSVTGLEEYRASHFCGKLRGQLILSSYSTNRTWRMPVDDNRPRLLFESGGLQVVADAHGNLVYPLFSEKQVFVQVPRITTPEKVTAIGVWPRRHPRRGGSKLRVAGFRFNSNTEVTINGRICNYLVARSTREIECTTPRKADSIGDLADVRVRQGTVESVLKDAILYTTYY